jgi:subtilisin family serine protease
LNLSLGGEAAEEHPLIISAVKYAESKGALLVIAAGNGDPNTGVGFSIDDRPVFPAALPDTNILSVGACDRVNTISPYSNFGKVGVDLTAPGGWVPFDSVVSATQENAAGVLFVGMNGTSMAAPIAAGIAAQVLSLRPSLTYSELRDILMSTGVEKPDLKDTTVSGRQINALNALQSLNKPALLAEAVLN